MGSLSRVAVATLVASTGVIAGCALHTSPPARSATSPLVHAPGTHVQYRSTTPASVARRRPNVFMITVDDASRGDFRYMPHVRKLLADEGVTLTGTVAPSPICVPARASLLTGQYAHNHGAYTISGPHGGFASFDDRNTLPVWLQKAGYDTLFVGKYLNGYGENNDPRYIPPGWNQWHALVDPSTYNFTHPRINDNGTVTWHRRYNTYLIRDRVDQLLGRRARTKKPWFLWANYVAPHVGMPREADDPPDFRTTHPAPQDEGTFSWLPLPSTPDMFHRLAHRRTTYTATQQRELRTVYEQRIEALQAVDRAVASHVRELKRTHQWSNTLVILSSDNGYAVGQHDVVGKLWYWQEISGIPAIIRGPGVPRGRTVGTLVSNPDLAMTVAAAAHAVPSGRVPDGTSILPLLDQPYRRRAVALEGWSPINGDLELYDGVRDGPWTYVRYLTSNPHELLFDHRTDPYELKDLSLSTDPAIHARLLALRTLSSELATCRGARCRTLARG